MRKITEKLREQRREAVRRYREKKRQDGLKQGWVKKDENKSKKYLTEMYYSNTISP